MRIFIIVFGFSLLIILAALAQFLDWSIEAQLQLGLIIGLGILILELILVLKDLGNSILKRLPFPPDVLDKKRKNVANRIAINEYEQVIKNLKLALDGSDFNVSHLIDANRIVVEMLKPYNSFKALSMLVDPDYWQFDKNLQEYLDLNYQKIEKKATIERFFIFQDEGKFKRMKKVLNEQREKGVKISSTLVTEIDSKMMENFVDISVCPELNIGLIVQSQKRLNELKVTQDKSWINKLESQFSYLKDRCNSSSLIGK